MRIELYLFCVGVGVLLWLQILLSSRWLGIDSTTEAMTVLIAGFMPGINILLAAMFIVFGGFSFLWFLTMVIGGESIKHSYKKVILAYL